MICKEFAYCKLILDEVQSKEFSPKTPLAAVVLPPECMTDADQLEHLAPFDASPKRYRHNRTGEDNADAHMKRQVMGREVVVAITKGKLDFGPWEQIFYGEFDGNRPKRVLVKVIGE
ncbi:MAG TPA: YjbQ family protein [Gemmataceae bacterium]|nr:YjbQ family protein [Gemmataceae bacterium]